MSSSPTSKRVTKKQKIQEQEKLKQENLLQEKQMLERIEKVISLKKKNLFHFPIVALVDAYLDFRGVSDPKALKKSDFNYLFYESPEASEFFSLAGKHLGELWNYKIHNLVDDETHTYSALKKHLEGEVDYWFTGFKNYWERKKAEAAKVEEDSNLSSKK